MGIVNVTPDSFYSGSRHSNDKQVVDTVSEMIVQGADIIDIGGYSTKPGAAFVSEEEEWSRVGGALRAVRREFPDIIISIDTFRSSIASRAFNEAGVNMINDISGGTMDVNMYSVAGKLNLPYVLMHIQGTPETMQERPIYDEVVSDIIAWFGKRIPLLLQEGLSDIIIDPGIGFGKTIDMNFEIIARLSEFAVTGMPVMAGISRKSLIWKTLEIDPSGALNGTTALNMAALMNGASILRVHDVREAFQTVTLFKKMQTNIPQPD
ncbi:MAG: dihydropteroate synthase [Bacteroidales bacterium]|nr:dihydropteroate synthase [Bacteroidales bacterium]